MKKQTEPGLFDEENRLIKLTKKKDPLVRLSMMIKWEKFRPIIEKAMKKQTKGYGGRPPYDYIMMFKVLILQRLYNVSDEQMEFQINDRLTFMRFLGLGIGNTIPDQNTIWLFRENLIKKGVIEKLFNKFESMLDQEGFLIKEGSIIDATIVEAPKQRNTRDENDQIRQGEMPKGWKNKPHMLRQKDTDARWLKKNGERYYGYKNHVKICRKSKLISAYKVTDASVHDSQAVEDLLDKSDSHHELYADSAYSGKEIASLLEKKKIRSRIHEKGYSNTPLTEAQWKRNRKKSKIRVRVEHVFGYMTNSMNGIYIRTIGIVRATGVIGLMNLTYNMNRYLQLAG
ncbi:MAG: IS5 family transposase [Ignavibacteriaceae bacterium]|nr:IS5 family transposase [Ignavibacteriaceae bacterium]